MGALRPFDSPSALLRRRLEERRRELACGHGGMLLGSMRLGGTCTDEHLQPPSFPSTTLWRPPCVSHPAVARGRCALPPPRMTGDRPLSPEPPPPPRIPPSPGSRGPQRRCPGHRRLPAGECLWQQCPGCARDAPAPATAAFGAPTDVTAQPRPLSSHPRGRRAEDEEPRLPAVERGTRKAAGGPLRRQPSPGHAPPRSPVASRSAPFGTTPDGCARAAVRSGFYSLLSLFRVLVNAARQPARSWGELAVSPVVFFPFSIARHISFHLPQGGAQEPFYAEAPHTSTAAAASTPTDGTLRPTPVPRPLYRLLNARDPSIFGS